ncbi:HEAT repeat domain-containing protein [Streptomyces sp. 8K308]|uniref:HEAT repeat domain-containing protein n=1 Tax=Streptomyces sp. 8K308 TaxID=2530388 RepID=UPI001051AE2D|nr:HEAT repeat domain-containing protein [Streptomyces sp. 8K308]TDC24605.1 HEAT repeat domain-containing protein [Streptomyces sp. 8K308]
MHLGEFISHRLVVKDSVTPEDVEALADSLHWELAGHVPRDPKAHVHLSVTWRVDEATAAHFTEDDRVDERYFVVSGDDWSRIEQVLTGIQRGLAVWSVDELVLETDVNVYPAGRAKAVLRLGVGAPLEPEESVSSRVIGASTHPDADVRRGALWAMAYSQWPAYRQRLREMAEGDPSPTISREASVIVDNLIDPGKADS